MATARKDLGGVKTRPSEAHRAVGPVSRRIPDRAQTIRHLSGRGVVPRRGARGEALRPGPEVAIRARVSTRQGEQDRARPSLEGDDR